jgi:formate-dependent nitrite reductase membrane component NrfD
MATITTDGRNVDLRLGELLGEGAQQLVRRPEHGAPLTPRHEVEAEAEAEVVPTYYGLSPIKAPPWKAWVPLYLYVGGVAGGAAVLGGASALSPSLRGLSRRSRWLAAGAIPVGTALLVADMGRPSRFLNMLRVFRPTSAINMGSWILSVAGTAAVASVVLPEPLSEAAALGAAASGTLVATYTGALLSNTVVPLWRDGRRSLPFLFAAGAASSSACLLLPFAEDAREVRVLRRVAAAGLAAELVASEAFAREVGRGPAGAPLRRGRTGALWGAAKALTAAALVTVAVSDSRRGRLAAAALGTLGALAMRFAIHDGGKRSAEDPLATFAPRGAHPPTAGPRG